MLRNCCYLISFLLRSCCLSKFQALVLWSGLITFVIHQKIWYNKYQVFRAITLNCFEKREGYFVRHADSNNFIISKCGCRHKSEEICSDSCKMKYSL